MKLKYILCILVAGCSYGILSTFVKRAYSDGYSLSDVSGAQAFSGAILLWFFFFLFYKKSIAEKQITPGEKYPVLKLLLAGAVSGLVNIFYYKSVSEIPASVAIVLLMQFTWISIVLERIFFKTPIHRKQIFIIVLILIGTGLAAGLLKKPSSSHLSVSGILYGLLGGLCYAIFLIANGRVGNRYTSVKKSAIMSLGMCVLIFALLPPAFLWKGTLHGSLLTWGILLGIFGTALPPLLFSIAIPKIGISLSSILSSMELPTAVLMSYFILKEDVDIVQVSGVVIILLSIVLANVKKQQALITPDQHPG